MSKSSPLTPSCRLRRYQLGTVRRLRSRSVGTIPCGEEGEGISLRHHHECLRLVYQIFTLSAPSVLFIGSKLKWNFAKSYTLSLCWQPIWVYFAWVCVHRPRRNLITYINHKLWYYGEAPIKITILLKHQYFFILFKSLATKWHNCVLPICVNHFSLCTAHKKY